MADSNITKRALAASLKKLMSVYPFSKVSIGEICEQCGMNRKSFYYHFRDKYDLVNWIFDREFVLKSKQKTYASSAEAFFDLCNYIYENKDFYRQAFKVEGQNSFSDCFTQYCERSFAKELDVGNDNNGIKMFHVKLSVKMVKDAIEHWLDEKEDISPKDFCVSINLCLKSMTDIINCKQ